MFEVDFFTPYSSRAAAAVKLSALYFDRIRVREAVLVVLRFDPRRGVGRVASVTDLCFDEERKAALAPLETEGLLTYRSIEPAMSPGLVELCQQIADGDSGSPPEAGLAGHAPPGQHKRTHIRNRGPLDAEMVRLVSVQTLVHLIARPSEPNLPAVTDCSRLSNWSAQVSATMLQQPGLRSILAPSALRQSLPDVSDLESEEILELRGRLRNQLVPLRATLALLRERGSPGDDPHLLEANLRPLIRELEQKIVRSADPLLRKLRDPAGNIKSWVPFVSSFLPALDGGLSASSPRLLCLIDVIREGSPGEP